MNVEDADFEVGFADLPFDWRHLERSIVLVAEDALIDRLERSDFGVGTIGTGCADAVAAAVDGECGVGDAGAGAGADGGDSRANWRLHQQRRSSTADVGSAPEPSSTGGQDRVGGAAAAAASRPTPCSSCCLT